MSEGAQLGLEIGYGLVPLVDERKGEPLMRRVTGIRRQISKELGFVIPHWCVSPTIWRWSRTAIASPLAG